MKFKKSEIAQIKWYNEQIKRAWAEKDGNKALQLEKECNEIGMAIQKEVLNRK